MFLEMACETVARHLGAANVPIVLEDSQGIAYNGLPRWHQFEFLMADLKIKYDYFLSKNKMQSANFNPPITLRMHFSCQYYFFSVLIFGILFIFKIPEVVFKI